MTNEPPIRFAIALALSAAAAALAADGPARYRDLLQKQGPAGVVQPLVSAYGTPDAWSAIESLAAVLAASPEDACAVLKQLRGQTSAPADSVRAELLYVLVARVGGRTLSNDPAWHSVVAMGVDLLEHEDPFVRGIAAWALVPIRDMMQDQASGSQPPRWPEVGRQLQPESSLECDYVLQAFARGIHRRPQDLVSASVEILRRAEGLGATCPTSEQDQQHGRQALETLRGVYDRQSDPTDLVPQRRRWIDLRRAAREVVLSSPAMDCREIVYFQVPPRTEGNHPDCLVQNHDRPKERAPGGDVFVQSGLAPASPIRPVIAGQLGPGHVQDLDLWWDADRLVFAFVRQPHWQDASHAWGEVAWKNGPKTTVFDHRVGFGEGVFWENGSEPTHLYEIGLDGTGLRTLTDDPLYCDREPAYLPNGDVVFSSDRGCGASQCGAAPLAYSDFGLPNLYCVSADGSHVRRLTYNKDVDRYPHCLDNGLIGYMRWDYQERFWQWPHALWTIRPDGTMNDGLYKTHFREPQSVREPRSIPASQKLVVIATGHHAPPEGAVAVVDPSAGINNPDGLQYVTPTVSPLEGGLGSSPTVPEGGVPDRGGWYRTPWPLSEQAFLVAYAYQQPVKSHFAVYYIDVWGNKELIHRDPAMDVLCPIPVQGRARPPVLPPQTNADTDFAMCYLDDVHRDLPGIPPGTVRYLRISERLQWFFDKDDNTGPIRWTPGTQHSRNFAYWNWSPARVIGTVPVEADGSAYFRVPTDVPVYFQALDENLMEIRRMRSHIEFQPGEVRGCVGCHETKQHVPAAGPRGSRLALAREPSQPVPPPWGDTAILDYEQLIQPIFAEHCVRCHDGKQPDTDLDLTDRRDPYGFMQSYRSLFGLSKDTPTPLGEGFREAYSEIPLLEPAEGELYEQVKRKIYTPGGLLCLSNHMSGPEVSEPKQFGSHQSRLVLTLLNDALHRKEATLSPDQWETLVTWVDANAPYHSTFYQYFDANGQLLAKPLQVHIDLDPPFQPGDKSYRIVSRPR